MQSAHIGFSIADRYGSIQYARLRSTGSIYISRIPYPYCCNSIIHVTARLTGMRVQILRIIEDSEEREARYPHVRLIPRVRVQLSTAP